MTLPSILNGLVTVTNHVPCYCHDFLSISYVKRHWLELLLLLLSLKALTARSKLEQSREIIHMVHKFNVDFIFNPSRAGDMN